ncbi:MAG: carbohydrate kinase family protein [Promethearchaeota archaeon]|nr:MAG: carbohydrate kinase family protein [Candidatus Lokiarchaeota archaeon]
MAEELLVVGELHQDLYYESDFYENLAEKITDRIINFIKYNPDDLLNRALLEKMVKGGFGDTPKKIIGHCYFKRGGNGNNSSEFLARLGIPTKLMSVIGRGSEWMIPELKKLGINTDSIFQIDEITPVSTIIKSNFTTKIHLAPNLKNKMNFGGVEIKEENFNDVKIIFSTPIAEKFIAIFEQGYTRGLITAYNIETQKIRDIEKLDRLINHRYDLFFLNFKDAKFILGENISVEEADAVFKKYAKIRVYTAGKDGSHIITDHFTIYFPGIEVSNVVDRTGAGDCYAAGFLTILMESVKNKAELDDLMKDRQEEFKSILKSCGEFATHSAIYKITKQKPPERKELDAFMDSFKIK